MNTCRLCKKSDEPLFKYGVRHYCHAHCGLGKWGAEFLQMLPAHMIGQLPWRALEGAGLLGQAQALILARHAKDRA